MSAGASCWSAVQAVNGMTCRCRVGQHTKEIVVRQVSEGLPPMTILFTALELQYLNLKSSTQQVLLF